MSRILLVDDDEDMLALTARWLEKAGYDVLKAASGKEALDVLGRESADLVLLDYAMPDMNGPEVLRHIRESEAFGETSVIIRTGMDDKEIADEVSALHPQKILPKAEGKAVLLQAVSEVLSATM